MIPGNPGKPIMIILCDLDGTLADCSHRLHFIQQEPKDWRSFFAACGEDRRIDIIVLLMNMLAQHAEIWITSGRSDECRKTTEKWLSDNNVWYRKLIMRKAGDHTDDDLLKVSWVKNGTIPKHLVLCAFDDRTRVVQAWRRLGITCFQVADGDF